VDPAGQQDDLQSPGEADAADGAAGTAADEQQQEEQPELSPKQKRMLADAESGVAAANAKLLAADAAAVTASELASCQRGGARACGGVKQQCFGQQLHA
jgi:hypothetical protein